MASRRKRDASQELMRQLAALGVTPSDLEERPEGTFRRYEPPGAASATADFSHGEMGSGYSTPPKVKGLYWYHDPDTGQAVALKERWEYVDGRGEVVEYCTWSDGRGGPIPGGSDLPLFGGERLRLVPRERAIHVVDGEEGVLALGNMRLQAVCMPEPGLPWQREWTELLSRRPVCIWVGTDGPGRKRLLEVADALFGRAREVRVMQLPGMSDGFGMARFLEGGGTIEDLERMVVSATPWLPSAFLTEEAMRTSPAPVVRWIVEGLLPEGACVLAGKPKMGKSLFALNLAQCVAHGVPALGKFPVDAGDVLYLALEDGRSLLKERLAQLMPGTEGSPRLHFRLECPQLHRGGIDVIAQWIMAHPNRRLVVIDTWEWVRPRMGTGSQYSEDHAGIKHLQSIALEAHMAIVVVHHLRKQESPDLLDGINASTGLVAAANGSLIMRRARGTNDAVLHAIHRSAPQRDYGLQLDPETCLWTVVGTAEEVMRTSSRRQVLEVLQEYGPLLPAELAGLLGWKQTTARSVLFRMRRSGDVNEDNGRYEGV